MKEQENEREREWKRKIIKKKEIYKGKLKRKGMNAKENWEIEN